MSSSHKAKSDGKRKERMYCLAEGVMFGRGKSLARDRSGTKRVIRYSFVPLTKVEARTVFAVTISP